MDQATVPRGVEAPVTPVTVAVKVIVLPKTGLDGAEVTINDTGGALATTIGPPEIGVAGNEP